MKWKGRRQSDNVEDRRGMSGGGKAIVGGGLIGIVILLLNVFGGENAKMLTPMLEQINQGQTTTPTEQRELTPEEKEMGEFVSTVFADTEDIWTKIFEDNNLGLTNNQKWSCLQVQWKQPVVAQVRLLDHFIALVIKKCTWI